MKLIIDYVLSIIDRLFPAETAYAHCDIPCGIYDPHLAQIGALTTIRMVDLMAEVEKEHSAAALSHHLARLTAVKEEHAEICKREVRVIWGDYFKADHIKKHPDIHDLVHTIMQNASKVRQGTDRKDGEELLANVNKFAEIFWETKRVKTKRVKAPYKPGEEMVVPILE